MNFKKISIFVIFALSIANNALALKEEREVQDSNPVVDAFELPLATTQNLAKAIFDLGDIVVNGKRLGSPFGEHVTQNVSSTQVIPNEDIQLMGARNLPEALESLPGVIFSDLSGNGEEPTLDLRGFNEGQDFIFLLDGVRLNEPKSNNINFPLIPINLIERIEISRGGESFLYGEGANGGVVNIVGLFPAEDGAHAKIKSLVGSFGEWSESFEASAKQKNYGIYMTGDVYHIQGFRQNSSVEKENFYTKVMWDVFEKGRVGLTYLYANAFLDRSGSIRETYLRLFGREATERPRNFSDLESNLGIVDFSFAPIESLVVSSNLFLRQTSELSVVNFATFDTNDNELVLDVDTWGFTLQVDHQREILWGVSEGVLFGIDYTKNKIDEEDYARSKSTLQRLSQTVDSNSQKEALGVFSKVSLSWNERLGGYYGIRYDTLEFTNDDLVNVGNNQPVDFSKISQSINAQYQIIKPLAFSVTHSRSFGAPTLADLYSNPLFGSSTALKPEETSNTEAGLRWQDEKFLVKSAVFLNRRVNEIGFDPNLIDGDHPFGRNTNFGKTKRVGIETLAESQITPWLRLRGSHTYIDAFFASNTPTAQISGKHIPLVPRNRFAASMFVKPIQDLGLNFDMIAVDRQVLGNDVTNERNGDRLPAYAVFNLGAIYKFKNWEFSFQIRNLFDEEYEIAGTLGAAPSVFNTDHTVEDNFFVPAPGRSYRGAVSYSW